MLGSTGLHCWHLTTFGCFWWDGDGKLGCCTSSSTWHHLLVRGYWHSCWDTYNARDVRLSLSPLLTIHLCSVLLCFPGVVQSLTRGAHCLRVLCLHVVLVASASQYVEAHVLHLCWLYLLDGECFVLITSLILVSTRIGVLTRPTSSSLSFSHTWWFLKELMIEETNLRELDTLMILSVSLSWLPLGPPLLLGSNLHLRLDPQEPLPHLALWRTSDRIGVAAAKSRVIPSKSAGRSELMSFFSPSSALPQLRLLTKQYLLPPKISLCLRGLHVSLSAWLTSSSHELSWHNCFRDLVSLCLPYLGILLQLLAYHTIKWCY